MVDPEPRRPMASLHQNTMVNASEKHALPPYLQARGKPGKGRLAMLKEDNAKFCAPKTRIPTPAPKKKSSAVTVPAPAPSFVSKIPSPKSSSETGGPSSTCTPEAKQDDTAQESDECSDAEAVSEDIASQLAHTPDIHALPTAEVQCEDRALEEAAAPGNAGHADAVAGLGTPQDFSSTVCNAGSPAGSLRPVTAGTTNEQRALHAFLAARTPAAGQLGLTPGTGHAVDAAPAGPPAAAAHQHPLPWSSGEGIACTPFLAGLDRTLPQLTPGISPEALAMFQAALPAGAMLAGADASSNQPEAQPLRMEPQAQPKEAQHSSPSATDLAYPQQAAQSPEAAVDTAESAGSAAWEGLLDLSPMPGNLTMASNMAFLDSPDMDTLSTLCQVSPMGSSGGRPTPVLFQGTSAAMQDMAQHAQQQAREAASDSVNTAAQEDGTAGNDPRLAALQDEESVGSASPEVVAGMHSRSEVPVASDTGASGVRTRPAPAQEERQQKVVRMVSPVNPVPQEVSRPMGVGRKGRAALPKAAEVCEVINPPAVPTTPTWRSIADTAPEEAVKGAIEPANTPAGSAAKAAQPAPATNYQLMLAHIVGGQYRSPTLGQQGAQGSPPAQKGCTYTPYLLASPAGIMRGGPSRFAPVRTPARTPATL
ncbi:g10975 [Coccomyxa viridis]|uniref:G10975 protein n=1 Tax=Coccomyxa viridis TaxID=1274662 RepID=A0ABP1GB78_9CHLO